MISLIIPAYRGNYNVFQKTLKFLEVSSIIDYEVLFVFDGGKNSTLKDLVRLSKEEKRLKVLVLSKNYGQHNAIICGIEHARGDWIVTMDEDLQHDPKEIPKLFKKQQEADYDVVYGKYSELNHSWYRNSTSLMLKKLLKRGIPNLHPDFTAFRLIKKSVADKLVGMNNSYTFLDGYLSWITDSVASTETTHSESQAGESSYSIKKLIEHSINIFVTFSNLPIRLLTVSAITFITFSFTYAIYIIISELTVHDYDPGFPTFVAFFGFGFGLVLFGLGVIGEYIARINYKTTNRPNYNVKQIINDD